MAKLVKHRYRVVPRDKHCLARLTLYKVRVVRHDGGRVAVELVLAARLVHPGTRVLAVTGIRVKVPESDVFAALTVLYLIDRDIRVKHGHIGYRRKSKIKQLAG